MLAGKVLSLSNWAFLMAVFLFSDELRCSPATSAPPSPDAADAGGGSAAAGAAATDDSGPAIACDWLPG